jgi:hypothetical protein
MYSFEGGGKRSKAKKTDSGNDSDEDNTRHDDNEFEFRDRINKFISKHSGIDESSSEGQTYSAVPVTDPLIIQTSNEMDISQYIKKKASHELPTTPDNDLDITSYIKKK